MVSFFNSDNMGWRHEFAGYCSKRQEKYKSFMPSLFLHTHLNLNLNLKQSNTEITEHKIFLHIESELTWTVPIVTITYRFLMCGTHFTVRLE